MERGTCLFIFLIFFLLPFNLFSLTLRDEIYYLPKLELNDISPLAQMFAIEDVDGDREKELVVQFVETGKSFPNDFSFGLYEFENNKWKLTSNTIRGKREFSYPISSLQELEKPYFKNISFPFDLPEDEKTIITYDIDGKGGAEILVPCSGPTYYGLKIYQVRDNKIYLLQEIEGIEEIFDIESDGIMELVGHYVTDFAFLSTKDKTYYFYSFFDNRFSKKDFLHPIIYEKILNKKIDQFKESYSLKDFHQVFLFQFVNGCPEEAKDWFMKNKRKIKLRNEEDKYLKEIEDYFYIHYK